MLGLERNKLAIIVLIVVLVIPFALYLTRDGFLGFDSYFFYGGVCGTARHFQTQQLLEPLLWSQLPCNQLILKSILVLLLGLNCFFLYNIGELVKKGTGWLTILFSFITPAILHLSFKLENDAFGLPFGFASIYFFIRYIQSKNLCDLFASIIILFFGGMIWGGLFYLLFGYALVQPLLIIVIILILQVFGLDVLWTMLPNFSVNENNSVFGGLYFLMYAIFWDYRNTDFWLPRLTWFFLLFGIINPKFFVLAVPFLSLTIVKYYIESDEMCLLFSKFNKKYLIVFVVCSVLFFSVYLSGFDLVQVQPNKMEIEGVQDLVRLGNEFDRGIQNDWYLGHLIWFYGGETEMHSGGDWKVANIPDTFVLTRHELDCKLLKDYENKAEFSLKLYEC